MFNAKKCERLMLDLGFNESHRGTDMLRRGIQLIYDNPRSDMVKGIYTTLAEVCDSNAARVERNMRSAIESAFGRADPELVNELFGRSYSSFSGKPTTKEFIARMARVCRED